MNQETVATPADQVRRLIAPNASPMTYWGTNTYLLGQDKIAVIDPGPADPSHIERIVEIAGGSDRISHIFVTHAHVDHSLGARPLSARTGAPIYAYGAAHRGQSNLMQRLVLDGLSSGGEGIDYDFTPDVQLEDGESVQGEGWSLKAIWTPGHISNHICLAFGDVVFSGDHVMGWATSIVSPPDGEVSAFLASCEKLLQRNDRVFLPGHGDPVENPHERTRWLIAHRKQREAQIIEVLKAGPRTPAQIVQEIYTDIPSTLFGAAERNVFAHVIDLVERNILSVDGPIRVSSAYKLGT
jgi:glyoxylase-like metal-dependent hydrolase (beta-lactamase superfamily II)